MIKEVIAQKETNSRNKSASLTLQATPSALEKLLEDKEPISPVLKLKIKAVFDRFEKLVKSCSDQLTATKYRSKYFEPRMHVQN